ncbi:tannase and feruloyl esterase [Mycena albidolilacea]|uniref:Carboxylic ester hydrolase n=1 Tax=Mycena albidolilacea TaxID=1033008 RepID=A0AAD6ZN73_9AGAR|nr:tannase and feruloyl esterase [Mycena albidolilacea]
MPRPSAAAVVLLSCFVFTFAAAAQSRTDWHTNCLSLKTSLHLDNTTILNTTYIAAPTNITTPGICQSTAPVTSAPLCRVEFVINTTSSSAVHAEAWLPDTWYGRFLEVGDGGLGGCIDYSALDYTTSLHFASVGTDNGHDGGGGTDPGDAHQFLNHPEVINDFAFRAIHVGAEIGKQIVQAYYARAAAKSYFLGCSTGGRQAMQSALKFPDDFDGILGGAPATDFNNAIGAFGMISRYFGAPISPAEASPKWIPADLWELVSKEILRQCDALDGVVDEIITDPDACEFRPEALQCTGSETTNCLTPIQVEALHNLYGPLYGLEGQLLYPRFPPGAEADPLATAKIPGMAAFLSNWFRFAVLNVTEHDFSTFGLADVELMDEINPGGIATFNGDLSTFRNRGGKFLSYHGSRDPLLPATNSKRMYDLIAHTLSFPLLDDFYRLFLIPGMGHCGNGLGASAFGQGILGFGVNGIAMNASSHNILLALVDWVESGVAPPTIIGTAVDGSVRTHCRYPQRSVWDGTVWICSD